MGFRYKGYKLYFKKSTANKARKKGQRVLKVKTKAGVLYRVKRK